MRTLAWIGLGLGVTTLAVAAAHGVGDASSGPGGKPKKPKSGGPKVGGVGAWAGPILDEGEALIGYSGERIGVDEKPLPSIKMGTGLLKFVTTVVDKFLYAVTQGEEHPFYPDSWTEPEGQIDELAAVQVPSGTRVDIEVDVTVRSSWNGAPDGAWYNCRRLSYRKDNVNATRILYAVEDVPLYNTSGPVPSDTGPEWGDGSIIPCLYAARRYAEAGLDSEIVPRPGPPDWYVAVGVDPVSDAFQRVALYLYTPPRIGHFRSLAKWTIRKEID